MSDNTLTLNEAASRLQKKKHINPAIVLSTPAGVETLGPINVRWEIGSITKVFSALLLAQLHVSGRVDMKERIAKFIPKEIALPKDFEKITFVHLATHQSGLPRLPAGMRLFGKGAMIDPYSIFEEDRIYQAIQDTSLKSTPGVGRPRYSNYGFGLLGFILELALNRSYEDLLMQELISPLGLESATFEDFELRQGNSRGRVVGPWHMGRFKAMGGLRMSAIDLSKFLAISQRNDHHLSPAFHETFKVRYQGRKLGMGLGWNYLKNDKYVGHGGGTLGAMTEAYINRENGHHVVLFGDGNPGTLRAALGIIK